MYWNSFHIFSVLTNVTLSLGSWDIFLFFFSWLVFLYQQKDSLYSNNTSNAWFAWFLMLIRI